MATGKPVTAPVKAKPPSLSRVISSLDGQWFASGSNSGLLCSAANPATSFSFEHVNDIWDLQFSPDSTTLLSVSRDQQAKLWSVRTGRQIGQSLQHMGSVELCGWSTDGRNFATAQLDGLIRVWQRPVDMVAPLGLLRMGTAGSPELEWKLRHPRPLARGAVWIRSNKHREAPRHSFRRAARVRLRSPRFPQRFLHAL